MRDPKRIDRIIKKLRKVWKVNPDWRLGQLIDNLCVSMDPFYIEDEDMEERLNLLLKEKKK